MPAWVLDSVALIDWFCGRTGVAPYIRRMIEGREEGAFSTITEIELWQGLRPGEEERHDALLGYLERVAVDRAVARRAGQLRREVGLDKLALPDAAIAATAAVTGRRLLTRNTRHFAGLTDTIDIEFYSKD